MSQPVPPVLKGLEIEKDFGFRDEGVRTFRFRDPCFEGLQILELPLANHKVWVAALGL